MYIMLPSKLKEYPSGKINDTILLLQPKRSNSVTNFGKTASELVVEKAIRLPSWEETERVSQRS
jgi:hypothetical protein